MEIMEIVELTSQSFIMRVHNTTYYYRRVDVEPYSRQLSVFATAYDLNSIFENCASYRSEKTLRGNRM